jgi:hypothetical protein
MERGVNDLRPTCVMSLCALGYGCVWLPGLAPSQAPTIQFRPVWLPVEAHSQALASQKEGPGQA